MIIAIIIFGVLFTIGNITWQHVGDPKVFYVPLALFLWAMCYHIYDTAKKVHAVTRMFLWYLMLLASGNIVKQVFYTEKIKQINDYIWGSLVTLWLLISIIRWAIRKQRSGTK